MWLSTKASRMIPRLTRDIAMSSNTLPALGMTVSSLLYSYRGKSPPPTSTNTATTSSSLSSSPESAPRTHVATCIPITLIRARFVAEEGGGWVAGGKGGVSLCVCVWERVEAVCVCGGGVVCAFCVWLLCLPVITPCNLAVKGWP